RLPAGLPGLRLRPRARGRGAHAASGGAHRGRGGAEPALEVRPTARRAAADAGRRGLMARAAAATTAGRAAPARPAAPTRRTAPSRRAAPARAPARVPRRASGRVRARSARRRVALPSGARVLDALLTGRVWIALVGVLLA